MYGPEVHVTIHHPPAECEHNFPYPKLINMTGHMPRTNEYITFRHHELEFDCWHADRRRARVCPQRACPWTRAHSRSYLPRLLTTLTPIAARDLLAAVPAGTGTIGATVKAIKTGICGALASAGRSEAALRRLALRGVDR